MRKNLLILVLLIVAGVLVWLISQSLSALSEKQKREESISMLPNLEITLLDGRVRMLTEIVANRKTILILFNTECDHCQYEAESIAVYLDQFPQNTQIIFLSEEPLTSISSFEKMYFGTSHTNLTFARADILQLIDTFNKISYPNIFIYEESGKLIQEFKGETKVETILSLLGLNNLD